MQSFLIVLMLATALVVRMLSTIVARIDHLAWLASLNQSFLGFCLSIGVGVVVAVCLGVNLDPAKAKPAVRFLLLPSTQRRTGAPAISGFVTSPTMERVGQVSKALLLAGALVLGAVLVDQLATRRLTPSATVIDGLLLLALVAITVVPKLVWLARQHRGG
ncbi:MAG: hypothetical protein ACYCU8_08340 [Ferrimicrobium acidiphilum]